MKIFFEQLSNISSIRVTVIGDIMLDKYTYGTVDRISPEAPIPIVTAKTETETLGGSGNVISNLRGLNVKVIPVGVVGDDIFGTKVCSLIDEFGSTTDYLWVSESQTTTLKTRIIAGNQHLLRVDWNSSKPSASEEKILKQYITDSINDTDVVIISDYAKGVCSPKVVEHAIHTARNRGIPVVVDPKGKNFSKYKGASCITPNIKETQEAVPFDIDSEESFEKAATWITENFNIDVCIITRGEDGMILLDKNEITRIPTEAQEVFDVSGAGDTVVATLAACIALELEYKDAVQIANAAASVVVSHIGTSPIDIESLTAKLNELK